MRSILKGGVNALSLCLVFPLALMTGFGRVESVFHFWAQALALGPGLPGDYLRAAYYRLTLEECALDCRISFGTIFAHPQARVGSRVFIGSNSVVGKATIGARTQIASGVQIISGRRQHGRGDEGAILSADRSNFQKISIGPDCWIGAGAVVAADVGAGSTIGAGAVVISSISEAVVAVGNPARVIRETRTSVS